MSNTYRALSILAKSEHGEDPVDLDLSVMEERDALEGGHLEIAPRKYRVLSDNYEAGEQGAFVDLALLKENEAALIAGGHIERVQAPEDPPYADEAPKGNASREEWAAFAASKGAPDEETAEEGGLTRDELRAKYEKPATK